MLKCLYNIYTTWIVYTSNHIFSKSHIFLNHPCGQITYNVWNRRPDGIVIQKNHRTLNILEFKRSSDRNKDFLRVKEDEANEQPRSIIEALRAAAPEWTFERINFVAGRRGAVVEDNFYNSSKGSVYKQRKMTRFWRHMCNTYAKRNTQ